MSLRTSTALSTVSMNGVASSGTMYAVPFQRHSALSEGAERLIKEVHRIASEIVVTMAMVMR